MAEEITFKPFTIEHIRAVGDFARAYLWDVKFPDAPAAFKAWFPANDLDEQLYSVESDSAEFFNIIFNYPKKLNLPKITLTFYDREDRINYRWIRGWIANTIFNLNAGGLIRTSVSTLESVVKEMLVYKLNHKKQPVDIVSYWVYPESISDHGTSENSLSLFSVPFIVAGMSPVKSVPAV